MPEPAPEPARHPFAYAIIRVVPRVERGESMNAGIVLHCRSQRFLGARLALDEDRLRALDPACDADEVRGHLDARRRHRKGPELEALHLRQVLKDDDRLLAGRIVVEQVGDLPVLEAGA